MKSKDILVIVVLSFVGVSCGEGASRPEASVERARAEMKKIFSLINEYETAGGSLPDTQSRLEPVSNIQGVLGTDEQWTVVDPWGQPYYYVAGPRSCLVVSGGPNRVVDTLSGYDEEELWQMRLQTGIPGDDLIMDDGVFLQRTVDVSAKQKATMGAMCSLATAFASYREANSVYPTIVGGLSNASEARKFFEPKFIEYGRTPTVDGWNEELLVWSNGADYMIVSLGSDGEVEANYSVGPASPFRREKFDEPEGDIVIIDGAVVRWPAGVAACGPLE